MRYAVDYLEPVTREHCYRVAKIVKEIAEYVDIGVSPDIAFLCGLYHDVGKIYIPDKLLTNVDNLSSQDKEKMKEHTYFGYNFIMSSKELQGMNSSNKKMLALCAGYHHETRKCTGYPKGYCIEDLPLIVSVVSVVDMYDKMTHLDSYTRIIDERIVIELIRAETGGDYPTEAGQLFVRWYRHKQQNT